MRGNCGGTRQCVIQAHVRDGVVIRVEPDDRYNQNAGLWLIASKSPKTGYAPRLGKKPAPVAFRLKKSHYLDIICRIQILFPLVPRYHEVLYGSPKNSLCECIPRTVEAYLKVLPCVFAGQL